MSPNNLSIFTYQQVDSRIVQNVVYNFITKKKHLYEKFSRGKKNRTPKYGFGDHCFTIKLYL